LQQQKRSKDVALKPISSSKKDIRPLPQLQECKEYDDERIDSSRVLKRRTDIFEEIDSETILPNPQDYTFKLEGILAK
jgi:transcription elongation GreA/GreB family factor